MNNELSRRDVLSGAAAVVAASVLPGAHRVDDGGAGWPAVVNWRARGVLVSGCGAACDCCHYMRVDCALGFHVRKIGDRFFVCGRENFFLEGEELILREADPASRRFPATPNGVPRPSTR